MGLDVDVWKTVAGSGRAEVDVKDADGGGVGDVYAPRGARRGPKMSMRRRGNVLGLLVVVVLVMLWHFTLLSDDWYSVRDKYTQFERCSVQQIRKVSRPFADTVTRITRGEFIERRDRLARALIQDGMDAFVVEPGHKFSYYVNVSQKDWEPWEPEERPFLMIVQPFTDEVGRVKANTTFLAPKFEAARVQLLHMPFDGHLQIITWEEHWNPYETLASAALFRSTDPFVMIDEEMRDFIQRGLSSAGFKTVGLGGEVEKVRQTKSAHELEILRAVNTGTVEAIRRMRACLVPGLTENEITQALDSTLRATGLQPFFDIVLFDEDASNPHGGTDGTKQLDQDAFVLIDVGAHLYGYSSDVTRPFLPPFSSSNCDTKLRLKKKLGVWNILYDAQTRSIEHFRVDETAASVDLAARQLIKEADYEKAFTHRVGHGIGIKAHESPYLNQGNTATLLRAGMTFTSEPGIYLVNEFGVRHEDVFLVTEGAADCLSCPRAIDAWTP